MYTCLRGMIFSLCWSPYPLLSLLKQKTKSHTHTHTGWISPEPCQPALPVDVFTHNKGLGQSEYMVIYTVTSRGWRCIGALSILHFAKLSDTSVDKISQLYRRHLHKATQSAWRRRRDGERRPENCRCQEELPNERLYPDKKKTRAMMMSVSH